MYQTTVTKNLDRFDAIHSAIGALVAYEPSRECTIIDGETGQLLFQYSKGHVEWMSGDFAVDLLATIADDITDDNEDCDEFFRELSRSYVRINRDAFGAAAKIGG